ncbi:MAG: sulfite exporter TauE/SafE family protein [Defluviitaleaceae bacterium]|nr:sulfite exporter TauE/SafE family protein [Defluviitaleaceae bacterium]
MEIHLVLLIILAFFLLSVCIAILATMAGIGGGVIFTPIMLAFTNINSLIIRATGLIVAMFSSPISIGVFTKKGLTNFRLTLVMAICQSLGALGGAVLAVTVATEAGVAGEGAMRLALGLILMAVAVYFFIGGSKTEWPVVKKIDKFTRLLRLDQNYFKDSDGTVREYKLTRAFPSMVLLFVIGIIGGFFGMGGGWAITPTLNMVMGMPMRLAAVNSGFILGIGGGVSIWPFIFAGGIIPLFVLPWLAGQIVGGYIGARLLARVRIAIVRMVLIGIMFFTSFTLIMRGADLLGVIGATPPVVDVGVFIIIMIVTLYMIVRKPKS